MQRIMKTTALVFAGALLLSGCASGGGGADANADPCEVVRVAVRDISNGAQNAVNAATDPAELQTKLEGLSERVDALDEKAADDSKLAEALDAMQEKIDAAGEYAATLPADATQDPDALAEQIDGIQAAYVSVTEVCKAK